MTLVLTLSSNGMMMIPMLIFKRRTSLPTELVTKFDGLALLTCNPKGWMNTDVMKLWIDKILSNFHKDSEVKYFVVLDRFSAHTCAETESALTSKGFESLIIPGGCTGILQPLDVCFNKPLKDRLKERYLEWMKRKVLNPVSKVAPPQYEELTHWLLQSLNDMSSELIAKSFVYCGEMHINYKLMLVRCNAFSKQSKGERY